MKTKLRLLIVATLLSAFINHPSTAFAQSAAFTYQGRLDSGGSPVNGSNDLTFTLYNAATLGATVGTSNVFNDLLISNGLFTVTLDFGAGAFDGSARWLQIAARPGASTGAYTNLAPRQPITSTPYAIFAGGASAAGVSGTLSAAQIPTLDAAAKLTGTVPDARLSTNVALLNAVNRFTAASNTFSGRVGIGTTSPAVKLTVATAPGHGIEHTDGIRRLSTYVDSRGGWIGTRSSDPLNFYVLNGGISMTVATNGNVGIGTATPTYPLSLGGSLGNTKLALYEGTSGSAFGFGIQPGQFRAHLSAAQDRFSFLNAPAGTEVMTIKGNGNVGIGTASALHRLQAVGISMAFEPGDYPPSYISAGSTRVYIGSVTSTDVASLIYRQGGNARAGVELANGNLLFLRASGTAPGEAYATTMLLSSGGNVGIGTTTPATKLDVAGEITCVAVNLTSDRNAKEQFKPVSGREVLAKVAALPITEWQYKTQGDARHIGPMAQDFHAAFGTGRDDKHITSVDADGVALAAIQGLNEKVDEKDARIQQLEQTVAELKELVTKLANQQNGGVK